MTELIVGLFIGVILIIFNILFFYKNLKEVRDHMKRFHEYKTNKKLYLWYLEWPGILLDTLILNSPNAIISLVTFIIGVIMIIGIIKEIFL